MHRIKTKGGRSTWLLARTFSPHPMGRDENVLMCFLITDINNDFDIFKIDKRSLEDVDVLSN